MYERKTWKNRETEFPGRRRMTAVDGQEDVYDISREEGLVLEEGDAFDADTMNNMEQRVEAGFDSTCPHLYKATFLLDGWTGDGPYTQTVAVSPVDDGPAVTAGSTLLSCEGIDGTLPQETKDAMSGPARDIARASKTLGDNTITVTLDSAPDVDVEIFFSIKQGGTPAVPPMNPVGSGNVDYIGSALGTQTVSHDFSTKKYSAYIFLIRNSQPSTLWTWQTVMPARTIWGQSNVTVYFGGQQQGGGYITVSATSKVARLGLLQSYDGTTITGNGALDVYGIRF